MYLQEGLAYKRVEVSSLDRGSSSGFGLCPSQCSAVLLLVPCPGVGSSGQLLNLIRGTGQFLKGLADALGDSLSTDSSRPFLSPGQAPESEVGPFLQVRYGLEEKEGSLRPKAVNISPTQPGSAHACLGCCSLQSSACPGLSLLVFKWIKCLLRS